MIKCTREEKEWKDEKMTDVERVWARNHPQDKDEIYNHVIWAFDYKDANKLTVDELTNLIIKITGDETVNGIDKWTAGEVEELIKDGFLEVNSHGIIQWFV